MVAPLNFHSGERDDVPVELCRQCRHAEKVGPNVASRQDRRPRYAVQCTAQPRPPEAFYCPRPYRCGRFDRGDK